MTQATLNPSPGYSLTVRAKILNRPGGLGRLTTAIGRARGDIGAVDIVSVGQDVLIRDLTINASSLEHGEQIVDAIRAVEGVDVVNVSDRVFLMHLGGKIEVVSKVPLRTRADLSMAYTPGVARICETIHKDPDKVFTWASQINEEMKLAAAHAIAEIITPAELGPEYIVPSVFDRRVTEAVAHAVNAAAHRTGVSRRREH